MSTLEELNQYADNVIQFTDNRPSNVIFSYPDAADISDEITTTLFSLQRNIDIIEIVQPTLTNIIFTVDVSAVSGASVTFSTLPIGVTSTNPQPGIFKVQGIDSVSDWDAIKTPSISIPSGTQGSFEYTCTIEYTNDGVRKSKSWTVGKFKPIAALQATSSMSITPTVEFGLYQQELVSQFVLDAQGIFVILGKFSVDCTATKFKGLVETFNSNFTFTNWGEFATTFPHGDDYQDVIDITANEDGEIFAPGPVFSYTNADGDFIDYNANGNKNTYYKSVRNYEFLGEGTPPVPRRFWYAFRSYDGYAVFPKTVKAEGNYLALLGYNNNISGNIVEPLVVKIDELGSADRFYGGGNDDTTNAIAGTVFQKPYPTTSDSDWFKSGTNHGAFYNSTYQSSIGISQDYVSFINESQDTVFVRTFAFDTGSNYFKSQGTQYALYKKQISGESNFTMVDNTQDYFAATNNSNKLYVWSMSTGNLLHTITLTNSNPTDIKIYGDIVMTVTSSATEIFDLTTGNSVTTLNGGVSVDACNLYIAVGNSSGNGEVYVYKRFDNSYDLHKTVSNPDPSNTGDGGGTGFGSKVSITDRFLVGMSDTPVSNNGDSPYFWVIW